MIIRTMEMFSTPNLPPNDLGVFMLFSRGNIYKDTDRQPWETHTGIETMNISLHEV